MKKILVTGSSGQVGRCLGDLSEGCGDTFNWIGLDLVSSKNPIKSHQQDLTDFAGLGTLLESEGPDFIVNTAAYTAVDKAESDQEMADLLNHQLPSFLMKWAEKKHIPILHFSTDYVYPGTGSNQWTEDSETGPLSVYGKTKLKGDLVLQEYPLAITARTSWVVSEYGNNFIKTMVKLGCSKESLNIVADQIGCITDAHTLAKFSMDVIQNWNVNGTEWVENHRGPVHVCDDGEISWFDLASRVFSESRRMGWPVTIAETSAITTAEYPTPATRPLNSRLSCKRLKEQFNFRPPDWKASVERILKALHQEGFEIEVR